MALSQTSQEPAVGVGVENVVFQPAAQVLTRKILIIGTYDETTYTTFVEDTPFLITSPEDVGSRTGFGFMLHSLALQSNAGADGIETWCIAQPEDGAGVAASGTITWTGPATEAGTAYMYVAGVLVSFVIASGDADSVIAAAAAAAITADTDLPVTATAALAVTTVTSKAEGPWGNFISLTFNWGLNEELPAGVTATVVDMASGAGVPDIDDALDSLGVGDDKNENHFTDVIHGYLQDSGTLTKLSTYNGIGDDFVGLYAKTIARPFRSLNGDTVAGSGGLSALVAVGAANKTDRTNGIIGVPGSPNHPAEIAAMALGRSAKVNNNRAEQNYIGQILPGVIPGAVADRWTSEYDNRDTAVKAGISTSKIKNGAVYMSKLVSFYHPDSVPAGSNAYANMRNISILQNVLYNTKLNLEARLEGVSIVADTAKVTNFTDRQLCIDDEAIKDLIFSLANSYTGFAWLYSADYTVENTTVQIRTLNNGYDIVMPIILSISGDIFDTTIQVDTSIAVLTS